MMVILTASVVLKAFVEPWDYGILENGTSVPLQVKYTQARLTPLAAMRPKGLFQIYRTKKS